MTTYLAIDQGTTSSRAVIYDDKFQIIASGQQEFAQHFPNPGWVEHDLEEIWSSVCGSIEQALSAAKKKGVNPQDISAIGITNQRETFGLWEKKSGSPLGPAVVWQCRRSADLCQKLRKNPKAVAMAKTSGLVLDPYFSGTKLKWLLDNDAALARRMKHGDIAFGTIDTFLIWRLTGGHVFKTDVSNASRTLMMDLKTCAWNPKALKLLGVNQECLPSIESSDGDFGKTLGVNVLPDGIAIRGVLGDQQAALFGQACFDAGQGKITFGTGAFMLINTGSKIKRSKSGLSTVAWKQSGKICYAVEGSVFIAGAAVQWLRDGLKLISSSSEVEELAQSVPSSEGVYFVPALSGLGSPYWAPDARGVLGGLTRGSHKAHVARAALEGVAYSVGALFGSLAKDAGVKIKSIAVDGGAARNNMMMQFQSDLLQCQVLRPKDVESTARGAVYMAALGAGFVKSSKTLNDKNQTDRKFLPQIKNKVAEKQKREWDRKVRLVIELENSKK